MDLLNGLQIFLEGLAHDPVAYSVVLFVYTVAATVFLPFPVEVALLGSGQTPVAVVALVLGAGKAVGSVIVFYLGDKVGGGLEKWIGTSKVFKGLETFVEKTRYFGMYILLSIPGMLDTVPLYLFALFNRRGVMHLRQFALVNFLASITRASIVLALFHLFNIRLV